MQIIRIVQLNPTLFKRSIGTTSAIAIDFNSENTPAVMQDAYSIPRKLGTMFYQAFTSRKPGSCRGWKRNLNSSFENQSIYFNLDDFGL